MRGRETAAFCRTCCYYYYDCLSGEKYEKQITDGPSALPRSVPILTATEKSQVLVVAGRRGGRLVESSPTRGARAVNRSRAERSRARFRSKGLYNIFTV